MPVFLEFVNFADSLEPRFESQCAKLKNTKSTEEVL